jgi:hypothetical protein
VPAPDVPPERRDQAAVAPAGGYRPGERVWAYREGGWRPAIVLDASAVAVLVRYLRTPRGSTGVDTVTAASLAARDERVDPLDLHPG